MLLVVLSSILKVLAAILISTALLIVKNPLVTYVLYGVLVLDVLAYGVVDVFQRKPKKLPRGPNGEITKSSIGEGNEDLRESDILINHFLDSIMDFCEKQGVNCTLMNQEDGLWLVKVNDDTGDINKIMNLSLPNVDEVNKDTVEALIKRTCDSILSTINQLKN